MSQGARVRFGAFVFDQDRRRLSRDDQPVHLTPKAFDLLGTLIAAAPRVVSRDELHRTVWPNVVVSDATLTGVVKELRHALEDVDGRILRTVHRVGYVFEGEPQAETASTTTAAVAWIIADGARVPLTRGEHVVGRDPDCAVCLPGARVSRRHARLLVEEGQASIEDLGSTNGTSVGGRRITGRVAVADGECIEIAGHTLYFLSALTEAARTERDSRAIRAVRSIARGGRRA